MIAALPMYDLPELQGATDAFWRAIADALRAAGVDAPDQLTRGADLWEVWRSPDLLLAQTCGLPYRAVLHPDVGLVGTPDYALPGCPPGYYNSVVIATARDLPANPRLAYNERLSQSGWAAALAWADARELAFGELVPTGGHVASMRHVAEGRADMATIDAQTWRLMERLDPVLTQALHVIDRTEPTPGLPLITARSRAAEPIAEAVRSAIVAVGVDARRALDLSGLVMIPEATYRAVPLPPAPEAYAAKLGI